MPLHLVIWACLLAAFSPKRFLSFQKEKATLFGITAASNDNSAFVVSRAFKLSLMLAFLSGVFGFLSGRIAGLIFGTASPLCISILQGAGACILLWGTLFVRSSEIETYKGQTLVEKVNQLLYRTIYCVGTAILVSSVFLPTV
jgi:hypothetical protein